MATVDDRIDIDRPISTVYNQWTQFAEFPRFMHAVDSVQQLDDANLLWSASIAGVTREWHARIVEQEPDRVIAWENTSGATNRGRVTFRPLDGNRTEVSLHLQFEPEGIIEVIGDRLGIVSGQATGDLERFKEFIEGRGGESGAWRGEIDDSVDRQMS